MFSVLFVYFNSSGHSDSSLVLPFDVVGALQSKTDDPKEVVEKLIENLQLEHTSLNQPEPETRKWIRCLARNANSLNRLDVVEYLRQITPAGTTGRCDTGIVNDDKNDLQLLVIEFCFLNIYVPCICPYVRPWVSVWG